MKMRQYERTMYESVELANLHLLFKERDLASSDGAKGLSDRPLETFGCHLLEQLYNYVSSAIVLAECDL